LGFRLGEGGNPQGKQKKVGGVWAEGGLGAYWKNKAEWRRSSSRGRGKGFEPGKNRYIKDRKYVGGKKKRGGRPQINKEHPSQDNPSQAVLLRKKENNGKGTTTFKGRNQFPKQVKSHKRDDKKETPSQIVG